MEKSGLKRHPSDKFYTSNPIVTLCLNFIKKNIDINNNDLVLEPSAGNGAFITAIKNNFSHSYFLDILPEHPEITRQDFLTFNSKTISLKYPKIHLIGNPPFGRQASLAIKFIKKSAEFCHSISFILPKSFKKQSLQRHFPLQFHLVSQLDLPKNSFLINNQPHHVPCVFQIWIKKNRQRILPEKLIPKQFQFVKKTQPHDISFRRVGVYAGEINTQTTNKSIQSHYFIKFNQPLTTQFLEKLKKIEFNQKNDTVGPKSISKQELIKEFNMIL